MQREPLTRYEMQDSIAGTWMQPADDGLFYLVADVEARDQAREAEIRALIKAWRKEARDEAKDRDPGWTGAESALHACADDLESLLTPTSQEGTTR